MANDPVTGPLSRKELQDAAAAPFGEARKIIRKHDPLWGLPAGEKIEWIVECRRTGRSDGTASVKASSQEEAEKLAEGLSDFDVDWDDDGDFEIISVEPTK
jgi:hypothetical protein